MKKIILALTALGLLALALPARAQLTPTQFGTNYGLPTLVATNSGTTLLSVCSNYYNGNGLSLFFYGAQERANTAASSNAVLGFIVKDARGIWQTNSQIRWTVNLNGTTAVRDWTNLPAAVLDNVDGFALYSITTTTTNGNLFPSNLWYQIRSR